MNTEFMLARSTPELIEYRNLLEVRLEGVKSWYVDAKSEHGRKRIEQMQRELEAVRSMYASIPAHTEMAATVLSGLQGEERILKSIIARMQDSEKSKKSIDEELESVVRVITYRQRAKKDGDRTIVADLRSKNDGQEG